METYNERQLDALGDLTRRALLNRLRRGPLPVGELARDLPVSRPAVSQHLRVLKEAHLVRDEAIGTRRFYRLDPHGFEALRSYFDTLWEDALEAFKAHIEASQLESPLETRSRLNAAPETKPQRKPKLNPNHRRKQDGGTGNNHP